MYASLSRAGAKQAVLSSLTPTCGADIIVHTDAILNLMPAARHDKLAPDLQETMLFGVCSVYFESDREHRDSIILRLGFISVFLGASHHTITPESIHS